MSNTATDNLIPPPFLFRFSVPCLYHAGALWSGGGIELGEEYRLPCFAELAEEPVWADVRAAWNESGIAIGVAVEGKRQPLWCRESRSEDSDGLAVWIDTRNMHNVHRATRFCHALRFLPAGGGRKLEKPVARQVSIDRANEQARTADAGLLQAQGKIRADGYDLAVFIPAKGLTGFDPAEHPKIGFTYAILDRELGEQTFSVGGEMPYQSDPSLWGTLELVR